MTDHSDDRTSLSATTRHLPARTRLIDRGLTLAQKLPARGGPTDDAVIEAAYDSARDAWVIASELSRHDLTAGPTRDRFRRTSLRGFHFALATIMMAYECSFSADEPELGDDLRDHAATASFLTSEGLIGIDIEPCLFGLGADQFDPGQVCDTLARLLHEVNAFGAHGSPYMRLVATFNPKGDELQSALKLPDFIINIDKIVQVGEESAAAHGDGIGLPISTDEALRIRESGIRRSRISLEAAYRTVVSTASP